MVIISWTKRKTTLSTTCIVSYYNKNTFRYFIYISQIYTILKLNDVILKFTHQNISDFFPYE